MRNRGDSKGIGEDVVSLRPLMQRFRQELEFYKDLVGPCIRDNHDLEELDLVLVRLCALHDVH